MKENKEVKISFWASHHSTIFSVTLVLLIVGILAIMGIIGAKERDHLRSRVELSVVMNDETTDDATRSLAAMLSREPYAQSVEVITKEEALKNWEADTGENLEELFGLNPLSPEIAITLEPDFTTPLQIDKISKSLRRHSGVEDVAHPETEMLESINSNLERAAWILGGVGAVFLLISVFLINNMVHLAIYSRRFTIHTMQLVGATDGYIRRPIVLSNALAGGIAGLFSALILGCIMAFGINEAYILDVAGEIDLLLPSIVCVSLPFAGALICSVAAWGASTRFLHKDYDALFK